MSSELTVALNNWRECYYFEMKVGVTVFASPRTSKTQNSSDHSGPWNSSTLQNLELA